MVSLSEPATTFAGKVKFDPEGFDAMMARIAAEKKEVAASKYEDLEPDYEYMQGLRP